MVTIYPEFKSVYTIRILHLFKVLILFILFFPLLRLLGNEIQKNSNLKYTSPERKLSTKTNENYFEFIYVDANSGQSSGGHSAVKFGDQVYHFQLYPDGIFHIVRETWFDFRYSYNLQENRSLVVTKVYPQKNSKDFWERGFNEIYIIQDKHLQNLKDIRSDLDLLEYHIQPAPSFGVEGLGYSENISTKKELTNHKKWEKWGINKEYLQSSINKIYNDIQEGNWSRSSIPSQKMGSLKYPMGQRNISVEYNSKIQRLGLLTDILYDNRLSEESLIHISSKNIPPPSQKEMEILKNFRDVLDVHFKKILPDTKTYQAYPQLLHWNIIRILEKILDTQDWYFLDSLTEHRQNIVWKDSHDLAPLSEETTALFEKVREIVFQKRMDWDSFLTLQDAANRVTEIQRSLSGLRPIRHIHGRTLPKRKGLPRDFPMLPLKRDIIKKIYHDTSEYEKNYYKKLQEIYPYHLITQNCTSEIFFSIDKIAKFDTSALQEDLGKHIDPLSSLSFIPFYASYDINKNYHRTYAKEILSYRRNDLRKLKKQSKSNFKFLLDAKESFVPTSDQYKTNSEDHTFLFFTDDTILLRPIYGMGNLLTGLTVFIAGIPFSPWDGGDTAKNGIKGIFFSLPELVFFNINKGTFLHLRPKDIDPHFPNESDEDTYRKIDNDESFPTEKME